MGKLMDYNPKEIYQFYPFEIGVEKVLKEKTIKFSNPINFNDPFDCYEKLIDFCCEVPEDIINKINEFDLSQEEKDTYLKEIKKQDTETGYHIIKKEFRDKHIISCFSKDYDEILMWSHYANKHDGICICYDVENQKGGYFVEVKYPEDDKFETKPFIYNDPLDKETQKNNLEAQKHLIKYKSRRWSYENEIRWVYSNQALENHKGDVIKKFEDLNIKVKEIIFGLKVPSEKVKNKIKELQIYGYEHVKFYQMKEVENEFKIVKKFINIEDIS